MENGLSRPDAFHQTHILKPQLEEFEEHALNEQFCLQLAAKVGLMRAESRILEIAGKKVLCVKRYDRTLDTGGKIVRWHQEDTCQAMGRYPNQKYQADGGPGAAEIVGLLDRFSDDREDDTSRFIMALALNWVIAGTDAHSKNYSLLHGVGNFLRLAPAYDLASWLPYERDANSTKVKLAMKIGGTYRLHQIDAARWNQLAVEADLPPDWVTAYVQNPGSSSHRFVGTNPGSHCRDKRFAVSPQTGGCNRDASPKVRGDHGLIIIPSRLAFSFLSDPRPAATDG